MASCEKCWADSEIARNSEGEIAFRQDAYRRLMGQRADANQICTAEEQAGPDAGLCKFCDRRTVHQHANVCMACGYDDKAEAP